MIRWYNACHAWYSNKTRKVQEISDRFYGFFSTSGKRVQTYPPPGLKWNLVLGGLFAFSLSIHLRRHPSPTLAWFFCFWGHFWKKIHVYVNSKPLLAFSSLETKSTRNFAHITSIRHSGNQIFQKLVKKNIQILLIHIAYDSMRSIRVCIYALYSRTYPTY